jgi:hypothetical protein
LPTWFDERAVRTGQRRFLPGYQGYVHADAFSGYDGPYLPEPGATQALVIEAACNAHARRRFYEARNSDTVRAHQALAYYSQVYELERGAKDFSDEQRLQMRQDLAVPILGQFHAWLTAQHPEVLPKSPLGEAIRYALNNWEALRGPRKGGSLSKAASRVSPTSRVASTALMPMTSSLSWVGR